MPRFSHIMLVGLSLLLAGVAVVRADDDDAFDDQDIEVDSVNDFDNGVLSTSEEGN